MSLSDDGKLFHTEGPATEKARLPRFMRVRTETAALVAVERCPAASDQVDKILTMYDHIWCMSVRILNYSL